MRLSRLSLRNFKCFEEASFEFGPSTLLIGANGSGKSTVLDAIACLFQAPDPSEAAGDWSSFRYRPLLAGTGPEPIRFEGLPGIVPGDLRDWGLDIPASEEVREKIAVVVEATFTDLTAQEEIAWGEIASLGTLRFGKRFYPGHEFAGANPYLVLDPDQFDCMFEHADWFPEFASGNLLRGMVEASSREIDGTWWVSLNAGIFGDGALIEDADNGPPRGIEHGLLPGPDRIVSFRGPDLGDQSPASILRPLLLAAIRRRLAVDERLPRLAGGRRDLLTALDEIVQGVIAQASDAFGSAIPRYVDGVASATLDRVGGSDRALEAMLGEVKARLARGGDDGPTEPLGHAGAGSQRAATLAALDLYLDPDLWPPSSSLMMLIEEPEAGLHPGAQRRVASSIRALATFGVQTVVATHSPVFIRAVPPEAVLLVRTVIDEGAKGQRRRRVAFRPVDVVREIARELGLDPSDALLARRFMVVEGKSDRVILHNWAVRLGFDPVGEGVTIVEAGGHGQASVVAQFLELAYEGADFFVVLDNGADTARTKIELEARFGNRVAVRLLSRTEIEGFFVQEAVEEWLRAHGARDIGLGALVADALRSSQRKRALRHLSETLLHRPYNVVTDGLAIASLMWEKDIDPEIKTLLIDILSER